MRGGDLDRQPAAGYASGGGTHVPAIADDGVTLLHDEPGARIRGRSRTVGQRRIVERELIESGQAHFAAVVHIKQQPVVAVGQLERLEYEDIRGVLDLAGRIARRKLEVGDDGIARM